MQVEVELIVKLEVLGVEELLQDHMVVLVEQELQILEVEVLKEVQAVQES
jgi:hypothetical protein